MFQLENIVVENVLEINKLSLEANVISIEGQSGSGKSTLLRLLNNLDDPKSGHIYFQEKLLTNIPPLELRKQVVMLPQSSVIFDGTIRDNLLIGLHLSGQKQASNHALEEMLKFLWIDKSLDTSAGDLSGGEKQRMSLGRILLIDMYLYRTFSICLLYTFMTCGYKAFRKIYKERRHMKTALAYNRKSRGDIEDLSKNKKELLDYCKLNNF